MTRSKTVWIRYKHVCPVTGEIKNFKKFMGVNPQGFYEKPRYICLDCGAEAEIDDGGLA
jgi:hypothetical protein